MPTRRKFFANTAGLAATACTVGPAFALQTPFEMWKTAYRLRMAEVGRVPFADTERMIADDETLMEEFLTGIAPHESADIEISYWEP